MYKEFYLMKREPFDSHPAPDLFYKSYIHQSAWYYLLQGIKQQEPIMVLAGEYGAGKTLLFLKLVRLLEKKGGMPIIPVPTPTYNFVTVLEKIIEKLLHISAGELNSSDESKLQQGIYEYFENEVTEKKTPIYVVIDDAQEFSYAFINKLRLFASYNCGGFFPIRIVFFAHHSFLKMLTYKKLVALGQRIKRIYYLKPLDVSETKEYIYYRLIYSGATGTPVFDDGAVDVIHHVSKGNPRLINNICDNCLILAGEKRVSLINVDLVCHAMEEGGLPGIDARDVRRVVSEAVEPYPKFHADAQQAVPAAQEFLTVQPQFAQAPYPHYYQPEPFRPSPVPPSVQQGYVPPETPTLPEPEPAQAYEPEPRPERASSSLWTTYGRLGIIVLLVIIILILASYILLPNGSAYMMGSTRHESLKVVGRMPPQLYSIPQTPVAGKDADSDSKKHHVLDAAGLPATPLGRKSVFAPVLLTEGLGS